eukprot:403338210
MNLESRAANPNQFISSNNNSKKSLQQQQYYPTLQQPLTQQNFQDGNSYYGVQQQQQFNNNQGGVIYNGPSFLQDPNITNISTNCYQYRTPPPGYITLHEHNDYKNRVKILKITALIFLTIFLILVMTTYGISFIKEMCDAFD